MTPFTPLDQMACNGGIPSFFSRNFLLQMQQQQEEEQHHHHHQPPQEEEKKRRLSVELNGVGAGDDDLSDDCSQAAAMERKRRLSVEQVRTLERSFELGNKLEPERKAQLAVSLGLQPRQIAIWFQNRRARWKTKQLERDFEALRRRFEALRSENESLQAHNERLQAEILQIAAMKGRRRKTSEPINLNKETEGSCSNRSESSSKAANPDSSSPSPAIESFPTNRRQPFFAAAPPEESFGSIFSGGVDDPPPPFWSWTDQHTFH